MATARHSPVGFVEIAGNGLDAFDTEIVPPPQEEIVAPPPVPAGPPMLEIVAAYPDQEMCPDAWRTTGGRRLTLRRLALGTFTLARAIALFPLVALSWILLRIGWALRLVVTSVWRLVTGTVSRVGYALATIGRGIRDAITGVVRLITGAVSATGRGSRAAVASVVSLIATAAAAVALGARAAIAGASRELTRVATAARSAVEAGGRRGIGSVNALAASVARTAATLNSRTRNAIIAAARAVDTARSALTLAAQHAANGAGRGFARVATTMAASCRMALATTATIGAGLRGTAASRARRAMAIGVPAARSAVEAARHHASSVLRSALAALMDLRASIVRASGATVLAGTRVTHAVRLSSAAALQRAERPRVRMAVAGLPAWAQRKRFVPALAVALAAVVATSLGITTLLLFPRQTARVAAPSRPEPVQEPASPSVVLAVAPVKQGAPTVQPAVARRAAPRPANATATVLRTSAGASTVAAHAPERAVAPARGGLSEAKVRDVWSKTDTRSLDRALASLRSATLAFERCDLRRAADDTAVAHCHEVPAQVAWTIDFRRDDGRWVIDGLASERRVQP